MTKQRNRVADAIGPARAEASRKPGPIVIQVTNPTAFSGQGSIIVLELADEDAALRVARKIAQETGRRVTVRTADMTEIATIPAVIIH